jgi:hypothetical protein
MLFLSTICIGDNFGRCASWEPTLPEMNGQLLRECPAGDATLKHPFCVALPVPQMSPERRLSHDFIPDRRQTAPYSAVPDSDNVPIKPRLRHRTLRRG